jgi:hypothetical protein
LAARHFTIRYLADRHLANGDLAKILCQDIWPRHLAKTFGQDILPRHFAKTFCQDILPGYLTDRDLAKIVGKAFGQKIFGLDIWPRHLANRLLTNGDLANIYWTKTT